MPHPPYSPHLALSDIFLFPPMKKVLKGKHFADVEVMKRKTAKALSSTKVKEFKTASSSEKSTWTGVLHQMEGI